MDVKYIPSEWEKMKDAIGDLIGLGRWGKGVIDELKDLSDTLENVEEAIARLDHDGVISFHHTSQKKAYQKLYEDYCVLYDFAKNAGELVDDIIDEPFYKDMDDFVEEMEHLSIETYTTKNRIGVKETKVFPYGGETYEVPKEEVSLKDLFHAGDFYSKQIKAEYEEWKTLYPNQDFSQEDYEEVALNTYAFQYQSIRDRQGKKEFWTNIGAIIVIGAATIICPPAGAALAAGYGVLELDSAVSGKDWLSGRELGAGERLTRGALSPLDIVPGVGSVAKFSQSARAFDLGIGMGERELQSGLKAGLRDGETSVDELADLSGKEAALRKLNAERAFQDGLGTESEAKALNKELAEAGEAETASSLETLKKRVRADLQEMEVDQISETDRVKLDKWKYRPSDEKYLKYKKTYDNPKYYNQETGEINWPPNDGFDGPRVKETLEPGREIDRYGIEKGGYYFSPVGTPYEQRALALHSDEAPYHRYKILLPFNVESGKIASWFDRPGGGLQHFTGELSVLDFKTGKTIIADAEQLKKLGYIEEIELKR
ncbi:TNT domain-containing protein [Camelliibacillus cellulosilyticus]|uniref:TNT domain-containing protein n=1 Tax=Camelliibacillus cellulosilyticus TaxID=2174486 RepID=A0ABV9GSU0_9BACL